MNKTIYLEVRHSNFWWGVYGFCDKTSWEDIIMYEMKNSEFSEIAWTCVCSRTYLESGLDELEEDPSESDFARKVKEFRDSGNIIYHYYYDKPGDTDFYEVPFEAIRNDQNIKPCSIETWYPGDGIGIEEVERSTIDFCKTFFGFDSVEVKFKEVTSHKEALESYVEYTEFFSKYKGSVFSGELIQQLENEWSVSRERVLDILNRYV